jgi:WD40 repeat protein
VAFAPDGKTLAAACGLEARNVESWDSVVLWDVVSRKRVMQAPLPVMQAPLPVRADSRASLAFTPDGKTLAAAYVRDPRLVWYDEASRQPPVVVSVTLWDLAEQKLVIEESLPVTYGSVTTVALSPNCKTLAAGNDYVRGHTRGGGVLLWDVAERPRRN